MSSIIPSNYLPSIDISPFIDDPTSPESRLVIEDVRTACISTGFFQIVGHGVSPDIQKALFDASQRFFALPTSIKQQLDQKKTVGFRGYDAMGSQSYEDEVLKDLKEGFVTGLDLPADDPRVKARRFFAGRNVWPSPNELPCESFKDPVETYYQEMMRLCGILMDIVAATLPYGPNVFDEFRAHEPACPLRLLHYPPTPAPIPGEKRQLGSSAHTDFGAITLLLQDGNAGLEILDQKTDTWVGVPPNKDAYVINMGDMMSKLTAGLYKSSVHRVVNKAKVDRYSAAFFFDGNIDYKLTDLARRDSDHEDGITAEQYVLMRVRETYGT